MQQQSQQMGKKFYVSITGLRLKSVWHYLTFAWHAVPCARAAESTPGNVWTSTKMVDGVQHTVTAWDSRASMMRFVYSPVHRQAMQVFPTIATGKTYGYWTDDLPSWDTALALWHEHGVEYEPKPGGGGCGRHHQGQNEEGFATTTGSTGVNNAADTSTTAATVDPTAATAKTCPVAH
jgi:hypothetical protein